MRAVTDWFWSVVSGGGGGIWQWFLQNWKAWLIALLVGGLVLDWVMWIIRWRPHWLLFGKKRRGSASDASGETGYAQGADAAWGAGSAWGAGTGFYSSETDHPEWTDMTLRTLSEIDPDWAGHVVMDEEAAAEPPHAPDGYYDEAYEEPAAPARQEARPESGYWEETQDEIEAPPAAADAYAQALPYEDDDFYGTETSEAYAQAYEAPAAYDAAQTYDAAPAYDGPEAYDAPAAYDAAQAYEVPTAYDASPVSEEAAPEAVPAFDPFAPYDDPVMVRYAAEEERKAREAQEAARAQEASEAPEPEEAQHYGRPGFWPGAQYPFVRESEPDAAEASPAHAAEPAAGDAGQARGSGRRRRRLLQSNTGEEARTPLRAAPEESSPAAQEPPREEAQEAPRRRSRRTDWHEEEAEIPAFYPPPVPPSLTPREEKDARPSRLVKPQRETSSGKDKGGKKRGLRTVTGKPVKRRGLMRFSATEEEPIAGLPPMEVGDAFHPTVHPDSNPDFAPDEGEEFER